MRWRTSRQAHNKGAWFLFVAAVVVVLAWTGQEKLQPLVTRQSAPAPPTAGPVPSAARGAMAGVHAPAHNSPSHDAGSAISTSISTHAPRPEEAAGARPTAAVPGPVDNPPPVETPSVPAPAPAEVDGEQKQTGGSTDNMAQEAGGWDQHGEAGALDDDDSHGLFAEELREDDDDAGAVETRSAATAMTTIKATAATTGSSSSSSSSMTVAECVASYGQRHFLREEQRGAPPILYSFPGKLDSSHHGVVPSNPFAVWTSVVLRGF